jgi:phosphoglycolate phosphatase
MMNYLLIWDIDGTLISTEGVGRRAMERAFLELYGVENALKEINMAGMLDSVILKQLYEFFSINEADPGIFYEKYTKFLEDELDKLGDSLVLPGAKALLESLKNRRGFFNAIGTGNIEKGARIKLIYANLYGFFRVGGFGDEEMERWELIKKAIVNASEYYGIKFKNEHICIIGDTPKDMECGKILGVKTIGVATGSYSMDELSSHGAHYVFENLLDKESFLKIFN